MKNLFSVLSLVFILGCTSAQVQRAKTVETAVLTGAQITCIIPRIGNMDASSLAAVCRVADQFLPFIKQFADAILAYAAERAANREMDAGVHD